MAQTVTSRSLIIHRDLAIGHGLVTQTRGSVTFQGQQIELIFIFRTLDEIRYLDTTRYTRVALHTTGQLIEYLYDSASTASDDGDEVLTPIPVPSFGRWRKVVNTPTTASTANLEDIDSAVNVGTAKKAGYMIWNTTTNKPVWAVATGGAAVWVDATGATAHTPV